MNPAQKALWFIESHLTGPLTLDDISDVAGVSRFHLVRAFKRLAENWPQRNAALRSPAIAWQAFLALP